jgi:D-amino peptidase
VRAWLWALASTALWAQPATGPRVLLYYDMEGISAIDRAEYTTVRHPAEYSIGRQRLTDDVNAAIRGLLRGGAKSITVVDAHSSGNTESPDILLDQMDSRAAFLFRDTEFAGYRDVPSREFDAIVCIGMHARARTLGFLAHTFTIEPVWRVNGREITETEIIAHFAAPFALPVVMVSGDDVLAKQLDERLPGIEYALVKKARGRGGAELLADGQAHRNIEQAAERAMKRWREIKPLPAATKFTWELGFQNAAQTNRLSGLPGFTRVNDTTVGYSSADFTAGYNQTVALIRNATAERTDLLIQAVRAHPDAKRILEEYERLLNTRWFDDAPPAAAPAPKRRYWGAQ